MRYTASHIRQVYPLAFLFFTVFFLASCGEEGTTENITQINQMGMEVVSSVGDLPKCTKDNEGEMAFVKGESTPRICVDKKWFATRDTVVVQGGKDTVLVKDTVVVEEKSSCTTKELGDKSGVKIVCDGDSVGVVLNGKNGEKGEKGDAGEAGENGSGCSVLALDDNSGLKVVCGGDSVGVVLNGAKGDKGDAGEDGKDGSDGEDGKDGSGCTLSQEGSVVTITCGEKSTTIDLGSGGSVVDTMVLDSEKVVTSLDSLVGYSQKGPFLKGSTVYLYELEDGRTLKQTNGNFTSNITRDDGYYKFTARDLVSQYALIVVDGHYRNEVTGNTSNSVIKLKAISDVHKHSTGANVNLLTHLELERVYYLVTRKKMTVSAAKRQAQREILNQFHMDLDDYADAEVMDVFGSTEADAALLALSILLQGDRSEADMMALLTEISNDMAEDGDWNDEVNKADSVKTAIAKWAKTADRTGRLDDFGNNVTKWGLGKTPAFEKFVRSFWNAHDGLGSCTSENIGEFTTSSILHDSSTYYCSKSGWVIFDDWGWEVPKDLRWNPEIAYDTMIDDRDLKVYKTVQIGEQTWMAENLNYADSVKTPSLKGKSGCNNGIEARCDVGGRLYTWAAAIDSVSLANDADNPLDCGNGKTCDLPKKIQGICPDGWRLPNNSDWTELFAKVREDMGEDVAPHLCTKSGWRESSKKAFDSYGFSALPIFDGEYAHFWSSEYVGPEDTYNRQGDAYVFDLSINYTNLWVSAARKYSRFSIRCIKD